MAIDMAPVGLILTAAIGGALTVSLIRLCLRPIIRRQAGFAAFIQLVHRPVQLFAALLSARVSLFWTADTDWRDGTAHVLLLALMAAGAWLLTRLLRMIRLGAEKGIDVDAAHDIAGRRRHTQVLIVYRVSSAAVWLIAVGAGLLTFPAARTFGAGVLASAGLAGVLAGLAAQSLLKDVFAGLQLAFGEALRLGDIVVVESEWGKVEDLTLTYVVIRIWDRRRLILPTSYFVTKPYANWTGRSQDLIAVVEIDADWRLPLAEARRELVRIVAASPHWDGAEQDLIVVGSSGQLMTIRATASVSDADKWWYLRCEIREKMIGWIVEHHPDCMPRWRVDTDDGGHTPERAPQGGG